MVANKGLEPSPVSGPAFPLQLRQLGRRKIDGTLAAAPYAPVDVRAVQGKSQLYALAGERHDQRLELTAVTPNAPQAYGRYLSHTVES